eukprot:GAHX01003350.1.p2 GENE.GAHX01003350.1~~GAHX01003350.1.p2  ORF type:complete len:70 (+),score=20.69 GAHX01003350.1:32-241(+)
MEKKPEDKKLPNTNINEGGALTTIKRKMEIQNNVNKLFDPESILLEAITSDKTPDQIKCPILLSLSKNL